jgi:alpha-ketoglutarate-dependent taurine dioxygenase
MLVLKPVQKQASVSPFAVSVAMPERNFVRQIEVSTGFNFLDYARDHLGQLRTWIAENGALLIRNTDFSVGQFAELCDMFGTVTRHSELSSPRTELAKDVYTSTDHPANQIIQMHNEQSYLSYWPMQAAFMCELPAQEGGATPISDCRSFDQILPDYLVRKLREYGVTYIRNFGPESTIAWRESYGVVDQEGLEKYCAFRGMRVVWRGEDHPTVYTDLPAFRNHVDSGEECFFNNIVVASSHALPERERNMLRSIYKDEMQFPINVTFGDGSPITETDINVLLKAYERRTLTFSWKRKDVVIADNMLTAHGRHSYVGPRKIIVRVNRLHDPMNIFGSM